MKRPWKMEQSDKGFMKTKLSLISCFTVVAVAAVSVVVLLGCEEPDSIGRFRAAPVTNIILSNLGVVDEAPDLFADARDPLTEDLVPDNREYVIGPGDVLDISIFELFSSNTEWAGRKQVSETGRITIPVIGTFSASGRTELELIDDIKNMLSPDVIRDPKISVVLVGSRARVYSISGAVSAPGQYPLNGTDFRISEALAQAGGAPQTNSDYAYVIRRLDPADVDYLPAAASLEDETSDETDWSEMPLPDAPGEPWTQQDNAADWQEQPLPPAPMTSQADRERQAEELLTLVEPEPLDPGFGLIGAENHGKKQLMASMTDAADEEAAQKGKPRVVVDESGELHLESAQGGDEWLDDIAGPEKLTLPESPGVQDDIATLESTGYMQEVVRVNLKELRSGNLSQNIIIKPGDDIQIPFNAVGVFHVMGQVSRPGPYSLTGDQLTLKQAIATAGPLTPLASPQNCEIIRRIGENREVTYAVNLDMLFDGTAPDVYLKPNDVINIGSHPVARWVAVVRQSFRATYGFGFVYDRNLADVDMGN